jgi:hypothetical protein
MGRVILNEQSADFARRGRVSTCGVTCQNCEFSIIVPGEERMLSQKR